MPVWCYFCKKKINR